MAAKYFYVSTSAGKTGTRTTGGGDASARTGAFSAMADGDVYATIQISFADGSAPPVAGDFIYVADDHSFSSSAAISYGPNALIDTTVNIISVTEADCTVYGKGAAETTTGGAADIQILTDVSKVSITGVNLSTTDNIGQNKVGTEFMINDATVTFDGSGDQIIPGLDGSVVQFNDCDLVWTVGSTAGIIFANYGGTVNFNNCTFSDGSGTLARFTASGGANGGMHIRINNCDVSAFTSYMWGAFGGDSTNDDNASFIMKNCKMHANKLFVEENLLSQGQYFLATNCSDVAAEAEYQFYQKTSGGVVEDSGDDGTSGGIYRVESTAFTGGNKVSFKCTTSAICSIGAPLAFDMPAVYADLTNSASDQITVYFASTATLTTANTWVEVSYPDATNKQLWTTVSSRASDILSSTALTADGGSSDWENAGTDLTSETESKITVATSGDPGAACVPHIKIFCTVPSITFYVDTTADLS